MTWGRETHTVVLRTGSVTVLVAVSVIVAAVDGTVLVTVAAVTVTDSVAVVSAVVVTSVYTVVVPSVTVATVFPVSVVKTVDVAVAVVVAVPSGVSSKIFEQILFETDENFVRILTLMTRSVREHTGSPRFSRYGGKGTAEALVKMPWDNRARQLPSTVALEIEGNRIGTRV